jgi:cullin 1
VYQEDFESYLLEATGIYYQKEADKTITQNSCPDYLRKMEKCLAQEVSHYIAQHNIT